jgi:serine/threonine-protein kinase
MAPEQAMGERAIDGRADIYALGAVLYESLVGEAPFTGPTVQAIVARVMTEQPRSITAQRRSVPPHVNAAVLRALEKLPADRFATPAEFARALVTPGSETTLTPGAAHPAAPRRSIPWSEMLPWSIAAIALLIAGSSIVRRAAQEDVQPMMHLTVALPQGSAIDPWNGGNFDISEDGARIAMALSSGGRQQIVIRDLASDSLSVLPGTSPSSGSTEFSPDGEWLAFNGEDQGVYKIRTSGGQRTRLGDSRWAHIGWVGPETILFTKNYDTGLYRVSGEGKDTATLTIPDRGNGELGHWWPQALPDGEHVIFTNYRTPADKSSIEVISLRSGDRKVIVESGFHARYASGHLIFARGTSLLAVPFDAGNLRTSGKPVQLPLSVTVLTQNGWAGFAVSRTGTLVYLHDPKALTELSWVDEGGVEEPVGAEAGDYLDAVPSPDGKKIALIRGRDVWIFDRTRRVYTRLTRTDQVEGELIWTPDSRAVLYTRDVPVFDIFRRDADGATPEVTVVASSSDKAPTSISPDGRTLLFEHDDTEDGVDAIELTGPANRPATRVIQGEGNQGSAQFSPDGLWITYESAEAGRTEVYLVPASPNRAVARQQVSTDGGANPRWGPDGRTIYYSRAGRIQRVRVNPRTGDIGEPEVLSKLPQFAFWRIAPDGRFLVGRIAKGSEQPSVKVVTNWTELLPRKK